LIYWAKEYLRDYYEQKDRWQVQLNHQLSRLAEILQIDEILTQIPKGCDRLIMIPHRFLHLFPLHALPIAGNQCLLDRFEAGIRYAPSCQLLQQAQNRKRLNFNHLFAVSNPTKDRPYTELAVESIRHHFNSTCVLVGEEATKAAIDNISLRWHESKNAPRPFLAGLWCLSGSVFQYPKLRPFC